VNPELNGLGFLFYIKY